jgi:glutamate synthase (NADPH) small chain
VDKDRLDEFERRCIQEEPAECVAACPIHVDARSFVVEIARGSWTEAWKVLRKTMPLPSVLARICDHPCELRCKRRECGDTIRIGELERTCVETPAPHAKFVPLPRRAKRAAVLGSGLSGLVVAWDLARKGYPVTVFDHAQAVGGLLLRFSEAVLPRETIEYEVSTLEGLGVELRLAESVDLEALRHAFDAVYWALDSGVEAHPGSEPGKEERPAVDPLTLQYGSDNVFIGGGLPSGAGVPARGGLPSGADVPARGGLPSGAGVPARGDLVSPISWALDGRRAAVSIDRYLQVAAVSGERQKEGPQPTRLFVSLTGIEPNTAVLPSVTATGYSLEEAEKEAQRCLRCECLECVKVCEYLEHFGKYPRRCAREIYNNASIVQGEHRANLLINSCTLCDLCTTVCPEDFSMPDLCLGARREMVDSGKMPPSAHEFALEDYAWSRGNAFALSRGAPGLDQSAYVFFPGCQLAGSNPAQVEAIYERLRSVLPGGVGLMLDCCGAPAYWAARQDLFEQGLADIAERWAGLGRPTIVFACPTCLALIGPRLEGARSIFLSQVLEEGAVAPTPSRGQDLPVRALHDPCTTRNNPEVQQSVRRLLALLGQPLEELALSRELTECCGYGGLEANANPELARRVAIRRGEESDAEFVTYCAMCRDSLAAAGKRTIHLLDLVFPGGEDPAGRARPGWSERRENRARLKERMLTTLWHEGGPAVEPWQAIDLYISDDIQTRLDTRRILLEDVQRVVHHAEATGEKLCHSISGRFLASHRARTVTVWVEYSPRDEGFEIHNAYGHRMTVETRAL